MWVVLAVQEELDQEERQHLDFFAKNSILR